MTSQSKISQCVGRFMFLRIYEYKDKQFCCAHNILTEGVCVTQLFSGAGI
jgi:hypothetical protein